MLAVDILANAIRANPRDLAAGTLSERYLRALHAAGYLVISREKAAAVETYGQGIADMMTATKRAND